MQEALRAGANPNLLDASGDGGVVILFAATVFCLACRRPTVLVCWVAVRVQRAAWQEVGRAMSSLCMEVLSWNHRSGAWTSRCKRLAVVR